jgi:MoxR-like ATPase
MRRKKTINTLPTTQDEIIEFIKTSDSLIPEDFTISSLKWKFLVRTILHGSNIMLVGPTGCGKTTAIRTLAKALNAEDRFFYFNLGSTQDPRSSLIGNTHFNKDEGTFFQQSDFINAIQVPNAIVLLDEITRAHPDAWNILMTVTDPVQRYVRLDESKEGGIIHVAEGVTFVATANIGTEYTATRKIDKAIANRFPKLEVDTLTAQEEFTHMKRLYPSADVEILKAIAEISAGTRELAFSGEQRLTDYISTRFAFYMGGMANDGFTLKEIAELAINFGECRIL